MSYKIKIPFAISKSTGEIVEAVNIHSDDDCDWKCFECGDDLIGVNRATNKQSAHFRHPNNSCEASTESFLHWITKKVFQTMHFFMVPSPIKDFEYELLERIANERLEYLKHENIPTIFDHKYLAYSFYFDENPVKIDFDTAETEVQFNSNFGKFVVDVVIQKKKSKILIEPYFTNPIDDEKFKKIKDNGDSVLCIDLSPFYNDYGVDFNIGNLKEYLEGRVEVKNWIHIKDSKFNQLLLNEENKFKETLGNIKELLPAYQALRNEESSINKELNRLNSLINKLRESNHKITSEMIELTSIINKKIKSITPKNHDKSTKSTKGFSKHFVPYIDDEIF